MSTFPVKVVFLLADYGNDPTGKLGALLGNALLKI
jgi:hypothetical protein